MACRNSLLAGASLAALLLTQPGMAAAQNTAGPALLTFEDAIARAETRNPSLAAARLRAPIDRAGVMTARERPNPDFRVELERETPTNAYSVALPLEVGGQRGRRIAVSEAAVRTGDATVAVATLEVRVAVRRAYFAKQVADARRAVFTDLLGLATRARDAATLRFNAGSAPRLEVLQADLALAQAQNDATTAAAAAVAAQAALNTLLGDPPDRETSLATPLDPVALPGTADALAKARAANTGLAVFARQIEEQQARVALARALRAPDVVAEGTVTRGSEPEFSTGWRAAASVTVPLFTRHNAAVAVEQATLMQVTAQRDAALAQLASDVTAASAVAAGDRDAYVHYRDQILPQVTTIETMADDSYRLGQTGVAAYLLALQTTRDARLRALQAAADFHEAVADLEHAMGTPLP